MNTNLAHALMTKTAAAQKRLATLEGREAVATKPSAEAMRAALRELSEVLEELRVATEQLHAAFDDLTVARQEALANAARYRELHEGLPLACILSDQDGQVEQANALAATLLNVAKPYLPGKPLLLFLPERESYFRLLDQVRSAGSATQRAMLRPRDRKPRPVSIGVASLPQQLRWCWVFSEVEST